MFETCAYCNNGSDELRLINSWTSSFGFRHAVISPSSFKGGFYGKELVVSCMLQPFLLFSEGKASNGKPEWAGMRYDIFTLIGKKMNFEVSIKPEKQPRGMKNGKPIGVLGEVAYGKADIGCSAGRLFPGDEKFVDCSPVILNSKIKIISNKPPKELDFSSFLKPISWPVWLGILIFLPVTAFIMYNIDKYRVTAERGRKCRSYWSCL